MIRHPLARLRAWWWLRAYDASCYLFGWGSPASLWVIGHAGDAEFARYDMRPEAWPTHPEIAAPDVEIDSVVIVLTAPVWATGFCVLAAWGRWNDSRERRQRE